jgi:hypothetical protein
MVQELFLVIYLGGQVAGHVSMATANERYCMEQAARWQVAQPMVEGRMATFACEWRQGPPRIEVLR